jgi:ribosomal protein S18 acetylase RimI-like enzyme
MRRPFGITPGFVEGERRAIAALLREYEGGLGVSLCFQGFEAEVAGLPGAYVPPRGAMLLARDAVDGDLAGLVALRPVPQSPATCEMKRLYVRPAARGSGLGRALALAAMDEARRLGYRRMCLDTLPSMREAQALYRSLGFRPAGASRTEPIVLLFERELAPA